MNSCRLIYKSIANANVINDAALGALEVQAAFDNKNSDICGILLFSDSKFLQVLEGDPKYVRKLYAKIIRDDRHRDVELIKYDEISEREFTEWNMKLVDLNSLDCEYRELLENSSQAMINEKYENAVRAYREIKQVILNIETSMKTGYQNS